MTAPTDSQQYLRVKSASAGGFAGAGVEVRDVQDYLNNMHPAVAVLHAMFDQPACSSVKPTENIDYHDIDRSTTAASGVDSLALGPGQSTTVRNAKYPAQLFTRLQTYHEGVATARESQQIMLYGVSDAHDYGIDNLLVRHVDIWERILHFGKGTEDTAGVGGTPANPVPKTQGLLSWAAWTGLERRHGTNGSIVSVGDGMNRIGRTYWTSFYDANGTPMSRDLFYNQIIGPAWDLGQDTDGAFVLCGPKLMNTFADFNFVPGRGVINERNIDARDHRIEDIIQVIQTPANGLLYLTPDRFLGIQGAQRTYDNTGFALGSGASITAADNYRGTINKTIYTDETVLTVMPSKFYIPTMLGISYKDLSTDGDYQLGMLVAQKGLACKHTFGVSGATNLVP